MDQFFDILRLTNAVLASIVFGMLVYKGRLYFRYYDTQQKYLYASFTSYALATAYGSIEAYTQGVPPGSRIIFLLIANTLALYAFVRYRHSALLRQEDIGA